MRHLQQFPYSMIACMKDQRYFLDTEQLTQITQKMLQKHHVSQPSTSGTISFNFFHSEDCESLLCRSSMYVSKAICCLGELLKNFATPLATSIIFLVSGTEADYTIQMFNTCDAQCT